MQFDSDTKRARAEFMEKCWVHFGVKEGCEPVAKWLKLPATKETSFFADKIVFDGDEELDIMVDHASSVGNWGSFWCFVCKRGVRTLDECGQAVLSCGCSFHQACWSEKIWNTREGCAPTCPRCNKVCTRGDILFGELHMRGWLDQLSRERDERWSIRRLGVEVIEEGGVLPGPLEPVPIGELEPVDENGPFIEPPILIVE